MSSYRYEGPKVHEDIAKSEAKVLANAIKHAGNKNLVDDEEIVRILSTRSKLHLMAVYKHYKEITGNFLDEVSYMIHNFSTLSKQTKPTRFALHHSSVSLCAGSSWSLSFEANRAMPLHATTVFQQGQIELLNI